MSLEVQALIQGHTAGRLHSLGEEGSLGQHVGSPMQPGCQTMLGGGGATTRRNDGPGRTLSLCSVPVHFCSPGCSSEAAAMVGS